jgi:branched-chain amino acid transport system substrate-binding protein
MRALAMATVSAVLSTSLLACGGASRPVQNPGPRVVRGSHTVDIYSSLPLEGAARRGATAVMQGIELGLAQAHFRAGRFRIRYVPLDDGTASAGGWDATRTAINARRAASDPRAVYYIGEFNSGASEISIPILNQVGLPQVSPTTQYGGLTTIQPGDAAGEPQKYYPTQKRTYLQLMPRDTVQAQAILGVMRHDGCRRVALADDRGLDGTALAQQVQLAHTRYGITVTSAIAVSSGSAGSTYVRALRSQSPDCFLFAGASPAAAARVTDTVLAALPRVRVYGGVESCTGTYGTAVRRGLPPIPPPVPSAPSAIAPPSTKSTPPNPALPEIQCLSVPSLKSEPGGSAFLTAYRAKFGSPAGPLAVYGYETVELALDTISGLDWLGNDKSALLAALFATRERPSLLGSFGFDANGNTTLRTFGLYQIGRRGRLEFERTVSG